jgi:hypothetical protein
MDTDETQIKQLATRRWNLQTMQPEGLPELSRGLRSAATIPPDIVRKFPRPWRGRRSGCPECLTTGIRCARIYLGQHPPAACPPPPRPTARPTFGFFGFIWVYLGLFFRRPSARTNANFGFRLQSDSAAPPPISIVGFIRIYSDKCSVHQFPHVPSAICHLLPGIPAPVFAFPHLTPPSRPHPVILSHFPCPNAMEPPDQSRTHPLQHFTLHASTLQRPLGPMSKNNLPTLRIYPVPAAGHVALQHIRQPAWLGDIRSVLSVF